MKKSFLREVERCNTAPALLSRTEIGLRQFYDYESRGIVPENPDQYFVFLLDGKRWWEWTLNQIAATLWTMHWPGWSQLARDFADDKAGFRQLRRRCRFPPDYNEVSDGLL